MRHPPPPPTSPGPRPRHGIGRFGFVGILAMLAVMAAVCLTLAFRRTTVTEHVCLQQPMRLEWVRLEDGAACQRLSDVVRVTFRRGGESARLTTGAHESAECAADPVLVTRLRCALRKDPEQWV